MLDDLTDDESALVDAAREGNPLVCDGATSIRAELIRELLLGRRGELDPRGVRLLGAKVEGVLELDYVTAVVGLDLVNCVIEGPVNLAHAMVPRLILARSRIGGIRAMGLRVSGDLALVEAIVSGAGKWGAVHLRDAHIGGSITMERAEMSNDSGPALRAERLRVGGILYFRESRMSGHGDKGAICLSGARIIGQLSMEGAEVHNGSGPALQADHLIVESGMFLERAVMSGHGDDDGAIRLGGSRVGGDLIVDGADISNTSGMACAVRR